MAFSFDSVGSGEQLPEGAIDGATDGAGSGGNPYGAVGFGGDHGGGGDSGDVDAFGTRFDASIHSGRDKLNADGSYRKKRGRRAGSGQSATSNQRVKAKPDLQASVDALSQTLMIVHAGIASVTKINELAIGKQESDALATAVANVLAEFDVTPDPKVQAIVGLVVTAGTIYGPPMYLYNERMKASKKKPEVVTMNGEHLQ